jgi:sarcosine oxidase
MTARAMQLWREHGQRWNRHFFHKIGVLWLAGKGDDQFERGSVAMLREAGIPYEEISTGEIARRWPQFNLDGVAWGIYEPQSGFLTARVACQAVVEQFIAEGGEYKQAAATADHLEGGALKALPLSDGSKLVADQYIFACGPWLGQLFPQAIGDRIRSTKQDMFFFGTPAGDDSFSESKLPVWGDYRGRFVYGIPASDGRGFKIADDTRGPAFDPTSGERSVSQDGLRTIREYLAFRFPRMKDAPLIETRVCQYENTPDNHFIIDRHPVAENVWLLGGGSGHGFKHGPALGEMVAKLVLENESADPLFRLSRFAT